MKYTILVGIKYYFFILLLADFLQWPPLSVDAGKKIRENKHVMGGFLKCIIQHRKRFWQVYAQHIVFTEVSRGIFNISTEIMK